MILRMMMEAFSFLLIIFLSLPIFDVEGVSPPEPTVFVDKEELYISETLKVSISYDTLPGVCLLVHVDGKGVQPVWPDHDQPGVQYIPRIDSRTKNRDLDVTFDCSETALFNSPVNVTASIFSSTTPPDGCEIDQEQLLAIDTAFLYDDRVSIEWQPHPADCYVNQSCSFSAKIGRVSHSLNRTLHLTANVTQTLHESQTIISPVNSKSADLVNFNHTFHQVSTFKAVLSVPDELRRNVYWKQQSLEIIVKTNMVLELQNEVEDLQQRMSHLESLVTDLTTVVQELPCQLRGCGEYSMCVDGHCNCTLPQVYNGTKCTDFVGCVNSPDACGSGSYGECLEPANPSDDRLYSCSCFDDINVSGDDCEKCSHKSFCSNHGNCTVNKSGQATCKCDTGFTGPNCQNCTKDCGHGHGRCVIENGSPICECDTNFRSVESDCDKCVVGWTGGICNELDCKADNMTIKNQIMAICHGGVCNEDGTGCDCTLTNHTGLLCQFKKCDGANASYINFCKDSGGICVFHPVSREKVCYCNNGSLVGGNETCPAPPPPSPSADPCDPPCANGGVCSPNGAGDEHTCKCPPGFTGKNCEDKESVTSPATPGVVLNQSDNNSQLLYGGLAVFIAALVVCVAAYLAYHNREKILELFGGKKESVVEMAMRSRRKTKGYKKLPTSIHDTLTHED